MISYVTIMRGVLRLCIRGISLEDLKEYVSIRGGEPAWVLRVLRIARTYGGFDWKVDERKGRIKITLTREDEEL